MLCKICDSKMNLVFSHQLIKKYLVSYYKRDNCDFLCTEDPYWLNDAYSSAIANSDTGIIDRNLYFRKKIPIILKLLSCNLEHGKFLDFAGGGGIFVRLMRDLGLDFYWYDKYCSNWLANGFEADLNKKYSAVTTFESFEHFVDPLIEIKNLLTYSDTIVFSTVLLPTDLPSIDWWYYAFETGQHISFYSKKTLQIIAENFGYKFYNFGMIHCLTKQNINPMLIRIYKKLLNNPFLSWFVLKIINKSLHSKTIDDMILVNRKCGVES